MKYLLTVLTIVLLGRCTSTTKGEVSIPDLVSGLQYVLDALTTAEFDSVDVGENVNFNVDPKINIAYKAMMDKMAKTIPTLVEMTMPSMGNESGSFFVRNALIFGANNTQLGFDAPGTSFNIENLTVAIPYLDITADSYTMNNFNLNNLVVLNGHGPLRIYLEDIFLHVKLLVKYIKLKFVVEHVPIFEIKLGNARLFLGNIGDGGPELENLLNYVANDVLPFVIEALNNDVQVAIKDPVLWSTMEPTFNNLFSNVLNTLKSLA